MQLFINLIYKRILILKKIELRVQNPLNPLATHLLIRTDVATKQQTLIALTANSFRYGLQRYSEIGSARI